MHTEKSLPLCIFCLQTCIAYNTVAQPHLTRGLGTLTYVKHAFPNLKRKGLQNKNCINIWHGTKRGYPENGKPDSTGGHWAGTLSCTRGRTGSSTRGVSCVSLGPGSPIKSRCSARLQHSTSVAHPCHFTTLQRQTCLHTVSNMDRQLGLASILITSYILTVEISSYALGKV